MKLMETLLFSQDEELFEGIISRVPFQQQTVMNIPVYRLEIDEDIAMLVYHFPLDASLPGQTLTRLKPHIRATLILVHESLVEENPYRGEEYEKFIMELSDIPTVIAVRMKMKNLNYLNEVIRNEGLHLTEQGKIVFWHPLYKPSLLNVWQTLWCDVQQV